jgi:hypothetical protein
MPLQLLPALPEQVLKTKALRSGDKQPRLQQFQASEIADLPPRLRALFEDNKVGVNLVVFSPAQHSTAQHTSTCWALQKPKALNFCRSLLCDPGASCNAFGSYVVRESRE